jgi:uncharacterized membrane protein YkvA (DUF1232 family)
VGTSGVVIDMLERLKAWARNLKRQVIALWFAYRHPDTPWYARAWAALVVAYAFSPIDLVPDFIPVIGLLDDALLIPLGIWVAVRLIPAHALASGQRQAQAWLENHSEQPRNRAMAIAIIVLWIAITGALSYWAWQTWFAN